VPPGLSAAAASVDPAVVWARIEAWTATRWTPRAVTFVVEGPGEFVPPLEPFAPGPLRRWGSSGWEAAEPAAGPLGYHFPAGTFELSGVAGSENELPPAAVWEAFARLAEYFAATPDRHAGSSRKTVDLDGTIQISVERSPTWMARALVNSGAADLLRPYRGPR
jgi:hypothetical protein